MAPVSLATLLPLVQPQVSSCPASLIVSALQDAARAFCRRTLAWVETVSVSVVSGQSFVNVSPVEGGRIWKIVSISLANIVMEPGKDFTYSGGVISFRNAPAVSGTALVIVAKAPANTEITIPEFLIDDWRQAIVNGALSVLLAMEGQDIPWTNAPLAQVKGLDFERAITEYRINENQAWTIAQPQVAMRRWV